MIEFRWLKSWGDKGDSIKVQEYGDFPSYYLTLQFREWPRGTVPSHVGPSWQSIPIVDED